MRSGYRFGKSTQGWWSFRHLLGSSAQLYLPTIKQENFLLVWGVVPRCPAPGNGVQSPTSSRHCLAAEERVLAGCFPALGMLLWPKQVCCPKGDTKPSSAIGSGRAAPGGWLLLFGGGAISFAHLGPHDSPTPLFTATLCFPAFWRRLVSRQSSVWMLHVRRAFSFSCVFSSLKIKGAVTWELLMTPTGVKSDCCSCWYVSLYSYCIFVQNHNLARPLQSWRQFHYKVLFLSLKQTHSAELLSPRWWDTVSFIQVTPSLFQSRKTWGQTLHKLEKQIRYIHVFSYYFLYFLPKQKKPHQQQLLCIYHSD